MNKIIFTNLTVSNRHRLNSALKYSNYNDFKELFMTLENWSSGYLQNFLFNSHLSFSDDNTKSNEQPLQFLVNQKWERSFLRTGLQPLWIRDVKKSGKFAVDVKTGLNKVKNKANSVQRYIISAESHLSPPEMMFLLGSIKILGTSGDAEKRSVRIDAGSLKTASLKLKISTNKAFSELKNFIEDQFRS